MQENALYNVVTFSYQFVTLDAVSVKFIYYFTLLIEFLLKPFCEASFIHNSGMYFDFKAPLMVNDVQKTEFLNHSSCSLIFKGC